MILALNLCSQWYCFENPFRKTPSKSFRVHPAQPHPHTHTRIILFKLFMAFSPNKFHHPQLGEPTDAMFWDSMVSVVYTGLEHMLSHYEPGGFPHIWTASASPPSLWHHRMMVHGTVGKGKDYANRPISQIPQSIKYPTMYHFVTEMCTDICAHLCNKSIAIEAYPSPSAWTNSPPDCHALFSFNRYPPAFHWVMLNREL